MKMFIIISTALMTIWNVNPTIEIDEPAGTTTITIEVEGLSSDKGKVYIGLYDSEGAWLSKTYKGAVKQISGGKATAVIADVPAGTYAVSCYHDENDNNKMDTGKFGIPTEDYACSNGATAWFSAPAWSDAKFEVTTGAKTVKIEF